MALEAFLPAKFNSAHKHVIKQANAIITEYNEQGYTLTLRQLHYQFVARDLYLNTPQNYKRLGVIVDKARKSGLIDWDAIQDRTRGIRRITVYQKPETPLEILAKNFRRDPWEEQPVRRRIEVWVEKDAAVGIVEPTCNALRVPYFSCRGYSSSTGLYEAGKRLAAYRDAGYETLILYLGDHDPSGVQMTEVAEDRVNMYSKGEGIDFRRIALTMPQIEQYSPPPNFTKETDSRTKWYEKKFDTDECWELDALSPSVVDALIRHHVDPLTDSAAWAATIAAEEADKLVLSEIISDWSRTKAAPAMLDMLREIASANIEGPIVSQGDGEPDIYEHADSGTLAMHVEESYQLLTDHGLRFDD